MRFVLDIIEIQSWKTWRFCQLGLSLLAIYLCSCI